MAGKKKSSEKHAIQYLNTDLDLAAAVPLGPLVSELGRHGIRELYCSLGQDGNWHATLETSEQFAEPETNIAVMLDAFESLSRAKRRLWSKCSMREFNIGYDCGDEPWAFNNGVTSETLQRLAAAKASLRITLYPHRPTRMVKVHSRKMLKEPK